MLLTGNLSLKKPEGTDVVNIDDLNQNMDILDVEVEELRQRIELIQQSLDKLILGGM